ncbi:MAG TPA: GAF domain-containing protein, partial [Candidatus Eremiobacteraeota bacterium]|nr:GAF domain-containing protein [Candidatus Eremiobacteraeota bacterium]
MKHSRTQKLDIFRPISHLRIYIICFFITVIAVSIVVDFPYYIKALIVSLSIICILLVTYLLTSTAHTISVKIRQIYENKLEEMQTQLEDNMEKLAREKEKIEFTYKDMEENAKVLIKTDFELTRTNQLLEEKVKGLVMLQEIGTLISSARTLQEVLKSISESIVNRLGYNRSLIILMKSGEKDFFIHRGVGFSLKNLNKFEKVIESGLLPYSVVKKEPIVVNNLADVPSEFHSYIKALDVKDFIEIPLMVKGEVIGSLIAGKDNYYDEPLSEKDIEMLSILTVQAAAAIETVRSTEAIIQAKNQIEAIINSIVDGIVVTDSAGKFILVNPAFERMFRLSEEEIKDKLL